MSLDPRSMSSPTSSGRSSPAPRAPRRPLEDALYNKDKSFRRYAAQVDRALALFDTAQQEWADYISFLGRLLKAIQAHPPNVTIIPHSSTVATRLAQCLNPALPSGVHQKALELYSYIFSIIGKDSLSVDLPLYFPGLSTVLSFASLSVRPLFLSLVETYILGLQSKALRPALKAIILSILPGLEEETSEDFERWIQVLDKLQVSVRSSLEGQEGVKAETGDSYFWQCFFLATITNPSRRQGALAYLVRRLPKFVPAPRSLEKGADTKDGNSRALPAAAEAVISPEPGLLIRSFAAGLADAQLLIQRGFLDLLVTHIPLDSPVLQDRISKADLERLVAAAAHVVIRRDMSLNRRLYSWFLGPEPAATAEDESQPGSPTPDTKGNSLDIASHHAAYFARYGYNALTKSIMVMITRDSDSPADRARPFRVCLSLMDRWEIGGLLIPDIFIPAMRSVHTYSQKATREQLDEVMRSASVFFDGVESHLIWGKLVELATSALKPGDQDHDSRLQTLKLIRFILSRFNVREEDMVLQHMPTMALALLNMLNQYVSNARNGGYLSESCLGLAFDIVDNLVESTPERAFSESGKASRSSRKAESTAAIARLIESYYADSNRNSESAAPPFDAETLASLTLRETAIAFSRALHPGPTHPNLETCARMVSSAIYKICRFPSSDDVDFLKLFSGVLRSDSATRPHVSVDFTSINAIIVVLTALQMARPSVSYLSRAQLPELIPPLVYSLWAYLSPLQPKYHVEAVRCLWQLNAISGPQKLVEAAVASIMVGQACSPASETVGSSADAARRFALLWTHTMHEQSLLSEKATRPSMAMNRRSSAMSIITGMSSSNGGYQSMLARPLLLLLESLSEENSDTFAFVKGWLQECPSLFKIFDVLVTHMQALESLQDRRAGSLQPNGAQKAHLTVVDDTKECLYYMKHFGNILRWASPNTWITLAEETVSSLNKPSEHVSLQAWLVQVSLRALSLGSQGSERPVHIQNLHRTAVSTIDLILTTSPFALALKDLELEVALIAQLKSAEPTLQTLLLEATLAALKLRIERVSAPEPEEREHRRKGSKDVLNPRLSMTSDAVEDKPAPTAVAPPPQLVDCIRAGFSSTSSRVVLDDWVRFLAEVLPLFADTIFQNLIPLVECFCGQISQSFEQLRSTFSGSFSNDPVSPESTLISLMNGLEQILAKGHDRLILQEQRAATTKTPEQPQSFFGNMVSGVFNSESSHTRTPTANTRLTVLLCFQDTVRICFRIWSWGVYGSDEGKQDPTSIATFNYTAVRMRSRARRILEHLFAAEPLECLEALAVIWRDLSIDRHPDPVLGLLNVLNGSRPKNTIPAIFNAVYSRTNPNTLDPLRVSTLTTDLQDTELVAFLVEYTKSLEDDAMDEIWTDCITFLRDVLANPMPHRQILPMLLEFTAMLGQKVDNTNFGEQRKMRRELGDVFTRLLTAMFTTQSLGYLQEVPQSSSTEKAGVSARAADLIGILSSIVPNLPLILVENDRITSAAATISNSVVAPVIKSKAFPLNVTPTLLELVYQLARVSASNKAWRRDVSDAFNDPRFFSSPPKLASSRWLPVIHQWSLNDKDRLPEVLSRLTAPTTAGIMFGVGADSARKEADRKTQLNLRRICVLILASPEDTFVPNLPQVTDKIVELLTATPASSPSSTTRAEVFMLFRAIVLKTSPVHLAPLWPILNAELQNALLSTLPSDASDPKAVEKTETYNATSLLQACKLLDELVVLDPDEFQLSEWLYITDTVDAVYKPASWQPAALADEIAEGLASLVADDGSGLPLSHTITQGGAEAKRTPFLSPLLQAVEMEGVEGGVTGLTRQGLVERVLRPWFGQLSIAAFEATYAGAKPDWHACFEELVADVFDE